MYEITKDLGNIYEEFGTWLGAADTPENELFDDWWLEWVKMENAGYDEVEDKEETYMAKEYRAIVRILDAEKWRRHNLLKAEYDPLQNIGWMKGWLMCMIALLSI